MYALKEIVVIYHTTVLKYNEPLAYNLISLNLNPVFILVRWLSYPETLTNTPRILNYALVITIFCQLNFLDYRSIIITNLLPNSLTSFEYKLYYRMFVI